MSLKKRMRVEAEKKERRKSRLSSLINGTDGVSYWSKMTENVHVHLISDFGGEKCAL